jgi:hypothetical protein
MTKNICESCGEDKDKCVCTQEQKRSGKKSKKMKTAKAEVIMFDLLCPYCEELIEESIEGRLSWPINESTPNRVLCTSCNNISLVPARVKGGEISRRGQK